MAMAMASCYPSSLRYLLKERTKLMTKMDRPKLNPKNEMGIGKGVIYAIPIAIPIPTP